MVANAEKKNGFPQNRALSCIYHCILERFYFMTNENEIWLSIPNYEDYYEVSNLGNVRSLQYKCNYRIKILKQNVRSDGYYVVDLRKNNVRKTCTIHQLVALCFIGVANGLDVNHKDGNRKNNLLENLEYISRRDNIVHGRLSMRKQNKTSKYVGVSWHKQSKKYRASICVNGKNKELGRFSNEEEASKAYQYALSQIEYSTVYASKN